MSSGQQFLNVMILPPSETKPILMISGAGAFRPADRLKERAAAALGRGSPRIAALDCVDYGSWRPFSPPTGVWPLALSPLEQRHAAAVTSGSCPPAVATHGAGLGGRRTDADGNDLDRVQGRQHVSA